MIILKVIHGYPMRYNAGSEIYSQALCHALAERNTVHVFTREEDPFAPDFRLRVEQDADDKRITVHLINNPRLKDRYQAIGIDNQFSDVLEKIRPDIVHVGHLNHLSTSLIREAALHGVPVIYTLHDYWLMCPRGQFIQMFPKDPNDLWSICDRQENKKCAERCYERYFSGGLQEYEADMAYWTDWVRRRMNHIRELSEFVDFFVVPARFMLARHRDIFGLPECKLIYMDYGFARNRLQGRSRTPPGEPFTFGYIGTHIPAKGIHDLIQAFGSLVGDTKLRIWGRPSAQNTEALQATVASLPKHVSDCVEWLPEYRNQDIICDVFNRCDAIVVPSIWAENSPLVIHEAQQARVPVITANFGGMAEYVHHEVNGLLFDHRSICSLSEQMQRCIDNPLLIKRLGERGYIYTETGDIPDINEHASEIESLYHIALKRNITSNVKHNIGPWRITFDTNPNTCNLQCIMCEEHSAFKQRKNYHLQKHTLDRTMSFDIIKSVVIDTVPYGLKEIIPSTMGEPLLYERFDDILELCDQYNIKLNLTTNGTFPRFGVETWAHKLVPRASDVKISWNGASKTTNESIMRGSNWGTMLNNVQTFVKIRDEYASSGSNRCRITFQLTFMESNVAELADIVKLAIDIGIDRIKGHHLWPHFMEIEKESMRRDREAIQRWNKAVQAADKIAAEAALSNGRHLLLENIFQLAESASEDISPGAPCPFLGQEAWVSACGRFNPCCAPDAKRRKLGEFGNLTRQRFMDIWDGETYRQLVKTYRTRSLCLSCNMRKTVEGTAWTGSY